MFQLEIIDACVSYIEKLQSQLIVTRQFEDPSDDDDDDDEEDGEDVEQPQQQEQRQQQLRRLSSYELEDCNGNVEK